ncbi:major histocompatibility complex class I-related gene protein-like [Protobothrops mucrosquamatus]|uniref:major histocompatibility complex class I-related gene protein-like n=1 Tax=Protobothrops mucrosquamatus TaxID=103944 RepID=UPI0010FB69F5|nr:major histocompatibility complex class I-related gene protein-like [Protobothrops mucrosquamatus]
MVQALKKSLQLTHTLLILGSALEGLRVNSGGAVSAEPPEVTVSSKTEVEDGMETRVCRLDGFYPRENDASWMRDREVWLQDTFRGSVAPNADGTFHSWLSIRIDPQEKGRYRCHVEHDGLQEPLDVAIKDPPMVTVNRTVVENGMEIHVCYMDGFYPKKIDASWRRDREVWQNDTLRGSVAPNADGTFHTWLSIRIDPKERGRYRCHVEHDGLQEPLDVAIKEKRRDGYKAPSGASSHSLKYCVTSISEPSQGLPHYVIVGDVDGQVFSSYDSNSRKMQPRVSWMEKVGKDDPQYWDRNTQMAREEEEVFTRDLVIARTRYNQSKGLHTWQRMVGCELRRDGSKGAFQQYGYDGRTFLTFDKETLTWVAPDPEARITQRKWDDIPGYNQRRKAYLEDVCIKWLEKHLSYGKETLLRAEPPEVTMSSKTEVEDGMETHVCRLDGFYPREIDASWTRDGEVWLQDTFRGSVVPNADGTFHAWLSIWINPKERGRYRCHVEHNGLQESLDVALEEPKSNLGLIVGCVVAGLVLMMCAIVGILVFLKRPQDGHRAAPTSEEGSNNSDQGKSEGAAAAASGAILSLCKMGGG